MSISKHQLKEGDLVWDADLGFCLFETFTSMPDGSRGARVHVGEARGEVDEIAIVPLRCLEVVGPSEFRQFSFRWLELKRVVLASPPLRWVEQIVQWALKKTPR